MSIKIYLNKWYVLWDTLNVIAELIYYYMYVVLNIGLC